MKVAKSHTSRLDKILLPITFLLRPWVPPRVAHSLHMPRVSRPFPRSFALPLELCHGAVGISAALGR
jgi:hypothetical protein